MNGYILIDKPSGWTSFDVVAKIRSILSKDQGKKIKVSHAGTLDPFATGLLVILVGDYTKRQDEFMKLGKTYIVEAELGKRSTTGDPEGDISEISSHIPSEEELKQALIQHTGKITQIPPAFSAIKVNGKRAYELARKGETIELKPREVTIHDISAVNYAYPKLTFTTSVSSGTYIRTLVEDIGDSLETGAYTTALLRTRIGAFDIANALKFGKETSLEELSVAIDHNF